MDKKNNNFLINKLNIINQSKILFIKNSKKKIKKMNKETIKVKIEEMKKKNESDDEMSSNESKDIILEIRNDTNKVVSKKNMNGIYNSPLYKRRRKS